MTFLSLFALSLVSATSPAPAAAEADEPHVALLVSVDDYGAPEINLNSPGQDSALLAEELAGTSFTVNRAHNVDRATFVERLLEVKKEARNGVVLFYFSGHAVQVNGENWLIPRGAVLKSVDQVPLQAVSVSQVLAAFSDARVRVVVLDACRTNPFGLGTKGSRPGLARDRLDDLDGTLISYAAAPGSVAYDGAPGSPSPFTLALVKHLRTPGLDLPNLFMEVRGDLLAATRDLPNGPQRSEEVSSLTARHRVFFTPPADVGGTKAPPATASSSSPASAAVAAAAAAAAAGGGAAGDDGCSIAVLDLTPRGLTQHDTEALPGILAELMANEVAKASGCHVISQGDIKGMVDFEAAKSSCSEDETSCIASLGEALGVDRILVGTIGKLGTDYVITVRLLDNKKAVVSARGEEVVNGGAEQLRRAAKTAIASLFPRRTTTTVVTTTTTTTTDAATAAAAAPASPAPASPAPAAGESGGGPSPLFLGGIGVGAVGVAALVGGTFLLFDADAHLGDAKDIHKDSAYDEARLGLGLAGTGVLVVAGGAALLTLGVIE